MNKEKSGIRYKEFNFMSYFQEEVDKLFPGCMTGKMFIEYHTKDPKGLRLGIEDPFYSQAQTRA